MQEQSTHNSSDIVYENEGFDGNGDLQPFNEQSNKLNGDVRSIVHAQKAASKLIKLTNKRRVDRHSSYFKGLTRTHLGLDVQTAQTTDPGKLSKEKQEKLNIQLLKHFVELEKTNSDEDEVDFTLIEEILLQGADINCIDKYGQTVLHEAARAWHTDVAMFLVERKADISRADKFGRTALHLAAATNYPEMVELLVEKGAYLEAETTDEKQTPLHFAARNDAVESLKVLIKLGANKESLDFRRRTPLFVAAELDRSETARFLIDVNADATVIDDAGQCCMTLMITNMGPVARQALDQFHRKDRANRKQYFFLHLLEPHIVLKDDRSLAKTPLEVIVNFRQLDLIMHPVIMRLIDVKWTLFGRRRAWISLFLNLMFILIWTLLGLLPAWFDRRVYNFPQHGWRIAFWILGCGITLYYVYGEVQEIIDSRKKFRSWKNWREDQIRRDIPFCHPKWPEEKKYLERLIDDLDDMLPSYFKDFWNYFDWTVYFCIFLVTITHIVDVGVSPNPPCCPIDQSPCTNLSTVICQTGFVNNGSLSVWNNRFFAFTIICLWLRLMKDTRAFRFLGPFIVMLGKILWDILRFLYLYAEFYIPYACAFWMIFGNIQSITTMATVDNLLFSLYRITLVDDYQFDEMQAHDIVMAYLLIGSFLGISAILCINLFIALLSDTFQRVYDNANANAVMQQATLMLSIEDSLSKRSKMNFRSHIERKGSPEELYYDDDLTVAQDDNLKKVTIQIKNQMDELLEIVQQNETEKRVSYLHELDDSPESPVSGHDSHPHRFKKRRSFLFDGHDDPATPRKGALGLKQKFSDISDIVAGKKGAKDNALVQRKFTGNLSPRSENLSDTLHALKQWQETQEQSQKNLHADVKDIKQLLWRLTTGRDAPVAEENVDRAHAPSFSQAGPLDAMDPAQQRAFLSRIIGHAPSEQTRSTSHGSSEIELMPLPGTTAPTSGKRRPPAPASQPLTVDVAVRLPEGDDNRENSSNA